MRKLFLISAAIFAAAGTYSAKAEVGVLAAVNRDMTGTRPAEQSRPIFIKEKLVQDERIVSTNGGGGQVLFLDQTSLTIAPNSEVVLDRYVYDPATDTGEMAVTVLRGAMRFVGGRISKTSPATINTPSATIGIRGGMGNVRVQDGSDTLYMHVAGFSSTITSGDQELTITREGGLASIGANGDLEYLGVADDDFIANAFRPGATGQGDGGASPSVGPAADAATGQVAEVVSGEPDAIVQAAISTTGEKQTIGFGELTVDIDVDVGTELAEANQMMGEPFVPPDPFDTTSFLATGLFTTTTSFDGQTLNDPNAFFQLIYSANANEGIVFVSLPDTGDQLSFIEGDQFTGLGDQFLVQLVQEGQFTGDTNLATLLLGDPSNSNFTLNQGTATTTTLDGNISINYDNSTLVQFLQSVDGDFTDAQVQFIEAFIEPGVDLATLQAELDVGLEEFKQLLQPLP